MNWLDDYMMSQAESQWLDPDFRYWEETAQEEEEEEEDDP